MAVKERVAKALGKNEGMGGVKRMDGWKFNPEVDPDVQRRTTYAEPSGRFLEMSILVSVQRFLRLGLPRIATRIVLVSL